MRPPAVVPSRIETFIEFLKGGAEAFIPVWEALAQSVVSDALKKRLASNDTHLPSVWLYIHTDAQPTGSG